MKVLRLLLKLVLCDCMHMYVHPEKKNQLIFLYRFQPYIHLYDLTNIKYYNIHSFKYCYIFSQFSFEPLLPEHYFLLLQINIYEY